ncbi:MAG: hypothetical protein HY549_04935 [Elusimicrobia bacterium]|nr:hypothetical protein [Elusimicrobiota bacterium]
MNTQELEKVLSWIRSTDLVEVSYKFAGKGFSVSSSQGSSPIPALPASRFTAVLSPGVGLFQWNEPGKARNAEEGASLRGGDLLGVVVSGQGRQIAVKSPADGRLARICVEAGAPVEFGQPLFFIEG